MSVGCAESLCTQKHLHAVRIGLKGGSSFLYHSELRVFSSDLHTPPASQTDPTAQSSRI